MKYVSNLFLIAFLAVNYILFSGCAVRDPNISASSVDGKFISMSVNQFMNYSLSKEIPIKISIPREYYNINRNVSEIPKTYSYWMPKNKVDRLKRSGDFPLDTGWIYGKISEDAYFDTTHDKFSVEGDKFKSEMRSKGFLIENMERSDSKGYPIVSYTAKEMASGKISYCIYIAMNLSTNVVFISYRGPLEDKELAESVWSRILSSLSGA